MFIIELYLHGDKFSDLQSVTWYTLDEVRSDLGYWIKNTEPYRNILSNLDPKEKEEKDIAAVMSTKECDLALQEFREYHKKVDEANKPDEEEEKDDEDADIDDYDINPAIVKHIKKDDGFKYDVYEGVVDTFYQSKQDIHFKKRSSRLREKSGKSLEVTDPEENEFYLNKMRELRDNDPSFMESIFAINRTNKIFRIEPQLLPIIF